MKQSSIIIGRQPLLESLQGGRAIDKILFQKGVSGESIATIRDLASQKNIPIQYVPSEKLNSITRINHQGVIAFVSLVAYLPLQDIIDQVVGSGEVPLFIILDGITDVRNIGAIARTAVCCGAQALILPDKGVGALNEEAMKSSAGALERINICRVNSLMKAVDELHLNGIKVYASEMTASKKLVQIDWKEPSAFVLGSEDRGVFQPLMKICDGQFKIQMASDFESLNVSVASGMILYEAMKQRGV